MHSSSDLTPKNSGDLSVNELDRLLDNAPKCRAAESQIHGYGLVAFERINQGEVIIDFSDPKIYAEKRFSDLEPWRLEGGKYTGISEETCLISEVFTKYSLLNHSRQPNAMSDFKARHIVALRDIIPGEEVTVDYRLEPVSREAKMRIQHFL